ncbi:hypothetical protein [Janthinobacterium fluminis]|uniref:Uncharacterized protein n=1 Tax=Janthinobacterium fluminis TaxID=2987524 RepID=A0ABT5K3H7_9BURK|nr:hypothetical protein [Janthinobacterium fluminis]MDC8759534.1 hypothetical protein [Janthinobacterium fluminis]
MMTKAINEFENFIDAVVDELIAIPDDQVLNDVVPATVQAEGLRRLQAAKVQAGQVRLAAAKAAVSTVSAWPRPLPSIQT